MIIATRTLKAITGRGEERPVQIRVFAPFEEDGGWRCRYEIDWPEDGEPAQTTTGSAAGMDSLAALQFALQALGLDLHATSYHGTSRLYWHEPGAGYGVIVPKAARDLLRGDDVGHYG